MSSNLVILPVSLKDVRAGSRPEAGLGTLSGTLADEARAQLQGFSKDGAIALRPRLLDIGRDCSRVYGNGENGLLGIREVTLRKLASKQDIGELRAAVPGVLISICADIQA